MVYEYGLSGIGVATDAILSLLDLKGWIGDWMKRESQRQTPGQIVMSSHALMLTQLFGLVLLSTGYPVHLGASIASSTRPQRVTQHDMH